MCSCIQNTIELLKHSESQTRYLGMNLIYYSHVIKITKIFNNHQSLVSAEGNVAILSYDSYDVLDLY